MKGVCPQFLARDASLNTRQDRSWPRAALWLVFLGPFFFLTYGAANWWTGQLPVVPSMYWEWERAIPFLPWLMLPYMSIDLFYAGSLFICKDKAGLDTHAKRLLLATVISVAGFLLFPLQFAFTRPEVAGFNGWLLDLLMGFDKPFNQLPSLHISLLIILWVKYAEKLTGLWKAALHLWFGLIALAVVGTWQHHVVDVLGGAVVGVLCLYLVPDVGVAQSMAGVSAQHRKIGARYAAGALAAGVWWTALAWGGHVWVGLGFAWTSLSLALVSLAYFGAGAAVFQKRDGQLSRVARLVLLPYLLGAALSQRRYARRLDAWNELVPGVLIGRVLSVREVARLRASHPRLAVLDLTAEFSALLREAAMAYRNLAVLDLTAPHSAQLAQGADFIEAQRAAGNTVFVHCALGISRSAAVVQAWLDRRMESASARQVLEEARPATALTRKA